MENPMPNYDYQCSACQHRWEEILPIARRDEPQTQPCPQCRKRKVQRRAWDTPPTMGVDMTVKPDSGFKARMEGIRKKLGRYNPRVRENIDRALDQRGFRSGPQ